MFPKLKVQFTTASGTSPRFTQVIDEETGVVQSKFEDCNKPLPSAENFDVANLVKAGITLKEVNTSVIPAPPESFDSFVESSIEKVRNNSQNQSTSNNKE